LPLTRQHRPAILAYLLLACVYLLYLPHANFVLDDWLVLGRYEAARQGGLAEEVRTASLILHNKFHDQFRFQWLSFLIGYLLFLLVGYSPRIIQALFLALQVGCAAALRGALAEMGMGSGVAFLSGAVFLLLPATHGALFWSHNCSYYLWSTFWFLLYVRSLARGLQSGRFGARAGAAQAAFLLLALFSGDPIFCLLLAGPPLVAWFMDSRAGRKPVLLAWATVGAAAPLFAVFINRAPVVERGVGLRYKFTAANLWANIQSIVNTYGRLAGLGGAPFYRLHASWPILAAAAGAALITVACLRREKPLRRPLGRTLALAAGLWVAAYGPIWFLAAHEFRYDYTASPYVALALSAIVLAMRRARLVLAGALAAWLGAAAAADIEQGWIPQARNLKAVAKCLAGLRVEPGDLIIVSNTTPWIGTAPDFAFTAGWAATPFAEHVTGIRGLEVARNIVREEGRLRVLQSEKIRDLKPGEAAHTVVLVQGFDGKVSRRTLLAEEVRPGAYRLYPLQGYDGPAFPQQDFTRDQLAFAEPEIYFVPRYSHDHLRH
jgi:hypothetical protein